MKKLMTICMVVLFFSGLSYGAVTVTEVDNGDGTYTYTLLNNTDDTIWNWAVWFTDDPGETKATDVTTDDEWVCPVAQHGYFPAEYIAEFPDVEVLDREGQPLIGPGDEGGFYQVYAGDFYSDNPREYDKDYDALLGGKKGWDGADADIQTNFGIGPGETGTLIIEAESMPGTQKSFSYNTTDYWYSMTSMDGATITTIWCDFEAHGTVVAINESIPLKVVETKECTGEDCTYTYTLTNNTGSTIWNWAVWFLENPQATSVTTDTSGWECPFAQHGYFPTEYIGEYPEVEVLDSEGDPLEGPALEGGFYQVYAGDFVSANPREYDKYFDALLGGERGWDGDGAEMRTNLGIEPGETGTLIVENPAGNMTGPKSFSYNTTDYWYSMTSMDGPTITTIRCDFELHGEVE